MGGKASLPILGGLAFLPENVSSQFVQSSHQEPSCSVALARHSSAVAAEPASPDSFTQWRALSLLGGVIMPAMWPELAGGGRGWAVVSRPGSPAGSARRH